ncbi:MAG: hypothetical protein NTV43_10945 [Methylococcales bacterium]|nr:hypothetical protein [Methylococcales bacterium]
MKKRKNPHKIDCVALQNPVAKYARQFNKAQVYADKNSYRRNAKHRKQEASLITLFKVIKEAAWFMASFAHNAYARPDNAVKKLGMWWLLSRSCFA